MNPSTPPPGSGLNLDALLTWAWIGLLSILGAYSSFTRKIENGLVRKWNFTELIGEWTTAGLTAIITANLCDWMNFPHPLKIAMVGIAAHMGSRALFKLESVLNAKLNLPPDAATVESNNASK